MKKLKFLKSITLLSLLAFMFSSFMIKTNMNHKTDELSLFTTIEIYVEYPNSNGAITLSRDAYRAQMSQYFTIYEITLSRRCARVEKWVVNSQEYINYTNNPPTNGGNTSQVIITESEDGPATIPPQYLNCF